MPLPPRCLVVPFLGLNGFPGGLDQAGPDGLAPEHPVKAVNAPGKGGGQAVPPELVGHRIEDRRIIAVRAVRLPLGKSLADAVGHGLVGAVEGQGNQDDGGFHIELLLLFSVAGRPCGRPAGRVLQAHARAVVLKHVRVQRIQDARLDVVRDGLAHLVQRGRLEGKHSRAALRAGAGAVERAPDAVAAGGFRIADEVRPGQDGRPHRHVLIAGDARHNREIDGRPVKPWQDVVGRPLIARVVIIHGAARLDFERPALASERVDGIAVRAACRARALVSGDAALADVRADDGLSALCGNVMGFSRGTLDGFRLLPGLHALPAVTMGDGGGGDVLHGFPSFLPVRGGLFCRESIFAYPVTGSPGDNDSIALFRRIASPFFEKSQNFFRGSALPALQAGQQAAKGRGGRLFG